MEEINKTNKETEEKTIEEKRKINLYPEKRVYDLIEREARKVDRSINKFCLLILKHHLKIEIVE